MGTVTASFNMLVSKKSSNATQKRRKNFNIKGGGMKKSVTLRWIQNISQILRLFVIQTPQDCWTIASNIPAPEIPEIEAAALVVVAKEALPITRQPHILANFVDQFI